MTLQKLLVWLLRFSGAVLLLAFPAVFLPADWMASTHRALGMGEFPRMPVVDYLARSIAALYGFHGVLVLIVSRDVVRYAPIVRYLGVMDLVFGLTMVGIDLNAGMPALWTMMEGPPLVGTGLVILYLSRGLSGSR